MKSSDEGFAINDSKGCGGVMRVAPVGLFHWSIRQHHSARDTFRLGCELAALTHGVILAVNHDGDSDSTGPITGNLLGARHGLDAIPAQWLDPLELRDVITEIAGDLYDFRDWGREEDTDTEALNERTWLKYPGY